MSRLTKVDAFVAEALAQDTPWQSQARTVAELRARSYHPDNCWIILHTASGVCAPWQYDAASMAVDDGATILKPTDVVVTDPGRWLLDETQQHNHDDLYSLLGHVHPWSDITPGAWKMFYSDGTPAVQELSLVSAGRFLLTAGASSAPAFEAAAKLYFDTTDVRLGVGQATPAATVDSMVSDAATGVSYALYVEHKTSSTSVSKVAGTGTGIKFLASATDGGTPVDHGAIASRWVNKTPGAYDSLLGFATVNTTGTLQPRARFGSDGLTLLNASGKEVTLDPSAAASDIVYTLPADNGDPGEVLVTDGSGVLSWGAPGAGVMATLSQGAGIDTFSYDGSTAQTVTLDMHSLNVWQATQTWRANAAGAGTAPMKFQPGTVMAAEEAGALEWDGLDLWITTEGGDLISIGDIT